MASVRRENKFCKNCKYYYYISCCSNGFFMSLPFGTNRDICNHPGNLVAKHDSIDCWLERKESALTLNSKNDCSWYKRKWYKFWV